MLKMTYNYKNGVQKSKNSRWLILPLLGIVVGVYMLINTIWPALPEVMSDPQATAKKLVALEPTLTEDRIYIPKVNADVAIVQIDGNEKLALERGAIQRSPSSGNPRDGGNFVVAAHRFDLGFTPAQTKARSPFYRIDKLAVGDEIYVDFQGTRYAYKVENKKLVESSAVEIEARTDDDRLTMYSCELAGPEAGREVIFAKPIGKVVWSTGSPKIKPL